MIWSVWKSGAHAYDYYECGRTQDQLNVERPSHLVSRTLGATVDQAAWPLPAGAKKIGSGPHAVGRIAVSKRSVPLGDFPDASMVKAGLLVLSGFLLCRYALKSPSRRTT